MIPRAGAEFHAFDYGTVIEAEVRNGRNQRVDLSGAFAIEILFMRPDGSGFSRPAQLGTLPEGPFGSMDLDDSFGSFGSVTESGGSMDSSGEHRPGQDGVIFYVVQPGDLDVEGQWYLQFYVEAFGGAFYSSVVAFVVLPNILSPGEVLSP